MGISKERFLGLFMFKIVCEWMFCCFFVCAPHACSAHEGQKRAAKSLWNWCYKNKLAAMWGLGIKLVSSSVLFTAELSLLALIEKFFSLFLWCCVCVHAHA